VRRWLHSGRVHIRDLVDLVGATGSDSEAVSTAVRHLYDWHNSRSTTGLQLTFAPAATAVLAIVAVETPSTEVIVIAIAVAVLSLVAGGLMLGTINALHSEYVFALRLAVEMAAVHQKLAPYPHGFNAPQGSLAWKLYNQKGSTSKVTYRSNQQCREDILALFSPPRSS
jgi:hypothetical protein